MHKIAFDRMDFNLVCALKKSEAETPRRDSRNILILGDFSGRANRGLLHPGFDLRRPTISAVDRDNFNALMAKLKVELTLPVSGGPSLLFSFNALDDFHPDHLYAQHEIFKPLQEIGSLPLHVYRKNGEILNKPCAEVLLSERAAEEILQKGFMPLLSFRDQDRLRLARWQSAADPLKPLAGMTA